MIGDNFSCGINTKLLCRKKIEIGSDCLLSWNITIMDTDFSIIKNSKEEVINKPNSIKINDKVWIGANTTILKGVEIANGMIIATGSTISKSNLSKNSIMASNKQIVIKENICWES